MIVMLCTGVWEQGGYSDERIEFLELTDQSHEGTRQTCTTELGRHERGEYIARHVLLLQDVEQVGEQLMRQLADVWELNVLVKNDLYHL